MNPERIKRMNEMHPEGKMLTGYGFPQFPVVIPPVPFGTIYGRKLDVYRWRYYVQISEDGDRPEWVPWRDILACSYDQKIRETEIRHELIKNYIENEKRMNHLFLHYKLVSEGLEKKKEKS